MYAFLVPIAFGWALFLYCVLGYYRPRRYNMWVVITLLFLFTVTFGIWGLKNGRFSLFFWDGIC